MPIPSRRLSAFYFCYFGILGCFLPFWSLYLKRAGFDPTEIGELNAMLVATKIVAPNFWGWLADKSGKRLRLIRVSTGLAAALFTGFFYRQDFSCFAATTLGFSFFWNATLPQFEAATLNHLKSAAHRYSRIRLWGSVGFIAAVLGVGRFLDDYSIVYLPYILLSLLVLNWLMAIATPETPDCQVVQQVTDQAKVQGRGEVAAFFLVYLLLQISHGPYYVFYSVYLTQHGYSAGLTGQLWALGVCAEIFLFIAGGWLLKVCSVRSLLLSSLVLSMFRWLTIAYQIDSLSWLISAQLLHAASFGLTHLVAIQLLCQYFGAHHLGKGQAFYSAISFGIGGMLGSLYSGYAWVSLGPTLVFVIAALSSGLALLLAFISVGRGR